MYPTWTTTFPIMRATLPYITLLKLATWKWSVSSSTKCAPFRWTPSITRVSLPSWNPRCKVESNAPNSFYFPVSQSVIFLRYAFYWCAQQMLLRWNIDVHFLKAFHVQAISGANGYFRGNCTLLETGPPKKSDSSRIPTHMLEVVKIGETRAL